MYKYLSPYCSDSPYCSTLVIEDGRKEVEMYLKKEHFSFLSGNNGNSWERTTAGLALYSKAASLRERPCHSSLLRRHWAQHLVQVHLVLVHHVQHLVLLHLVHHSCASANDLATLFYFGDIGHNFFKCSSALCTLSRFDPWLVFYYENFVYWNMCCVLCLCAVCPIGRTDCEERPGGGASAMHLPPPDQPVYHLNQLTRPTQKRIKWEMLWFLGWVKFNLSILEHYLWTSLNESSFGYRDGICFCA